MYACLYRSDLRRKGVGRGGGREEKVRIDHRLLPYSTAQQLLFPFYLSCQCCCFPWLLPTFFSVLVQLPTLSGFIPPCLYAPTFFGGRMKTEFFKRLRIEPNDGSENNHLGRNSKQQRWWETLPKEYRYGRGRGWGGKGFLQALSQTSKIGIQQACIP